MGKVVEKHSKKFWFVYIFFSCILTISLYIITTGEINIKMLNEEKKEIENNIKLKSNNVVIDIEQIPNTKNLLQDIITYHQFPDYPTGCESIALYILLKYYEIDVTPNDIINDIRKGELPYVENDTIYGGNPEIEFIGDPNNSNSYGVYNQPLAEVANMYKPGIISQTNFDFTEVLRLIDNNHPVLVWVTINLTEPYISNSWIYKPTGEVINWISGEHAMVVIGYNEYEVIVSDPYTGQIVSYDMDLFINRYNYLGGRALYY